MTGCGVQLASLGKEPLMKTTTCNEGFAFALQQKVKIYNINGDQTAIDFPHLSQPTSHTPGYSARQVEQVWLKCSFTDGKLVAEKLCNGHLQTAAHSPNRFRVRTVQPSKIDALEKLFIFYLLFI